MRTRRRENPEAVMSLWDHLGELRTRVIRAGVYLAIAFVVCFFFFDAVLEIISAPWLEATGEGALNAIGGPVAGVAVKLKVVTYMALVAAMPFILWEAWRFVAPGLTSKERRWVAPFFPVAFVMFCLGVFLGYVTWPKAAEFLAGFAGESIDIFTSASEYIGFYAFFMLAFGITFQFPIILFILQAAHIVTWSQLLGGWRYALVIIVVFAAIITPSQDPYSLLVMAIPMIIFYFAAILLGWIVFRDRPDETVLES
ncbi:MAG: twin-arginine translocase subunit TatC [Acidimicrobiia bacterium]|nr:twin-arginine translocase subunit TatC [Acidimicrobiia bacterium]